MAVWRRSRPVPRQAGVIPTESTTFRLPNMKKLILSAIAAMAMLTISAQQSASPHALADDFNDSSLRNFRYGSTGKKDAFKYAVGINSPAEPGTKVLLFRIDPADSAGPGRGPEIISKDLTHFGSYSARIKIPDVRNVQPNAGAVVGYFTYHMDSLQGLSEIDIEWLIADPRILYIGTWTGHTGKLPRIGRTI